MKMRMYYYLMFYHNFQQSTLNMLNYPNLRKLALEYGFKK